MAYMTFLSLLLHMAQDALARSSHTHDWGFFLLSIVSSGRKPMRWLSLCVYFLLEVFLLFFPSVFFFFLFVLVLLEGWLKFLVARLFCSGSLTGVGNGRGSFFSSTLSPFEMEITFIVQKSRSLLFRHIFLVSVLSVCLLPIFPPISSSFFPVSHLISNI